MPANQTCQDRIALFGAVHKWPLLWPHRYQNSRPKESSPSKDSRTKVSPQSYLHILCIDLPKFIPSDECLVSGGATPDQSDLKFPQSTEGLQLSPWQNHFFCDSQTPTELAIAPLVKGKTKSCDLYHFNFPGAYPEQTVQCSIFRVLSPRTASTSLGGGQKTSLHVLRETTNGRIDAVLVLVLFPPEFLSASTKASLGDATSSSSCLAPSRQDAAFAGAAEWASWRLLFVLHKQRGWELPGGVVVTDD